MKIQHIVIASGMGLPINGQVNRKIDEQINGQVRPVDCVFHCTFDSVLEHSFHASLQSSFHPSFQSLLKPLQVDVIHLFEVDLGAIALCADWWAVLSTDERDRALRYPLATTRSQFITTRGYLRHCLATYLGIFPQEIEFCYGTRGKPAIAPHQQHSYLPKLAFNYSHSRGTLLLGITRIGEIGVDLEAPRSRSPEKIKKIARRFFLPAEFEHLSAVFSQNQADGEHLFIKYWTCKEAYLKAIGCGLVGLQTAPIQNLASGYPIVPRGTIQLKKLTCGWWGAIVVLPTDFKGSN